MSNPIEPQDKGDAFGPITAEGGKLSAEESWYQTMEPTGDLTAYERSIVEKSSPAGDTAGAAAAAGMAAAAAIGSSVPGPLPVPAAALGTRVEPSPPSKAPSPRPVSPPNWRNSIPLESELPDSSLSASRKRRDGATTISRPSGNEAADSEAAPGHWERSTLEKLAFASLNEQKATRHWKNFFRLAWLVFFIALVYLAFRTGGTSAPGSTPSEHTAVVEIRGEIASGAEASAEYLNPALRAAFEEGAAKGVVLVINSPGGSPVQAGMIYDEIKRLKALHKKPVIAVVEESAASAAYYIAVAADNIVVNKASIVGSIGVLMDGFGFTGLMEKVGVERRLMTAGENKGFLDPFSPQTDKQRVFSQAMLDQIHQQFIATVKEGRGKRLKETPDTFTGLFWVGQQAIELGLADSLGTVSSVARDTLKAEDIVDYTRHENVAEKLAKRFGAAVGEGAVKAMGQRALQIR